jgi:hypothetical protein
MGSDWDMSLVLVFVFVFGFVLLRMRWDGLALVYGVVWKELIYGFLRPFTFRFLSMELIEIVSSAEE